MDQTYNKSYFAMGGEFFISRMTQEHFEKIMGGKKMLQKKKLLALILMGVMLLSLAGCGNSSAAGGAENKAPDGAAAADEGEVVIGVYLPMTGANAAGGEMSMEGINLALEQTPEVLGRKIKMVLVDEKSDKVEAANAVTRLITKEKACVIVGSYSSGTTIPGSEVANQSKVPMISSSATNPLVTMNKEFAFRACFIDPLQGSALANYAVDDLKAKSAMIILDRANDYSVGLANYFKETFEKRTGATVEEIKYNSGDQDFSAQLTVVKASQPDILFIPAGSYGDAGLIASQARDLGITSVFMGGDTWDTPEFAEIGGAAIEGSFFSTHFDPEQTTESAQKYCKAFEEKYNKPSSSAAALSYDAFNIAVDAINRAGSTDPLAIRDAMANVKDYVGVTGVINFDENRNPIKDVVVEKISGGKFVFQKTVRP
jgi:branched-chain amino acid transport system substrate-binding protein